MSGKHGYRGKVHFQLPGGVDMICGSPLTLLFKATRNAQEVTCYNCARALRSRVGGPVTQSKWDRNRNYTGTLRESVAQTMRWPGTARKA